MRNGGRTWAFAALACSVALTGCSSTVRGTATVAAGPAESSSAAPSTAPPDAADLEAALPRLADLAGLSGGWRDGLGQETDDWTRPTLSACLGGRDTAVDRVAVQGGQVLGDDSDDRVSSMVVSYRSQQAVDEDDALLTSAGAQDCFRQMFEEQTAAAQPGVAELGPVTVTVATPDQRQRSAVVATVSGSFTVTRATGERFPAYFDLVFLTGRMTEAQLILEGPGRPFPADARDRLVAALSGRLAAL